jgi:hypothetical protein
VLDALLWGARAGAVWDRLAADLAGFDRELEAGGCARRRQRQCSVLGECSVRTC